MNEGIYVRPPLMKTYHKDLCVNVPYARVGLDQHSCAMPDDDDDDNVVVR